jgi:hypothetical protein
MYKTIPISLTVRPNSDEAEQLAARCVPKLYTGFRTKYKPEIIHSYRQHLRQKSIEELKIAQNEHFEPFISICTEFKQHIQQQNILGTTKDFFTDEIDVHIRNSNVNLQWLKILFVRYTAAVQSGVLNDFFDCFAQIVTDKLWHNHAATLRIYCDNMNYVNYENNTLAKKIKELEGSYFSDEVFYPCIGIAHLGIAFLASACVHRIALVAIMHAGKRKQLHGMKMDSFQNCVHDFIHGELPFRTQKDVLCTHVINKAIKFSNSPYKQYQFADWYMPHATLNYKMIFSCLTFIYNAFISRVLPQRGAGEFAHAIAGLFFIMHEVMGKFKSDMLDCNDIINIIQDLVRGAKSDFGQIGLNEYKDLAGIHDQWKALDDSIALLKLVGISFSKPILTGSSYEECIEVVTQTVNSMYAHLVYILDKFEKIALFFLQEHDSTGHNMTDRYFQWHFRHKCLVDEQINKTKTKTMLLIQ